MADAGRQSFTDKASSAMKPDSQKSMTEQVGDSVKGTADSLASTMQPQKSTSQQVGDSLSSNSNENQGSMMDKAKDMLGMSK
ncbi:hypothetical protein BN946_scf185042.g132 [Trametes cinnabarina]|uniref:Heat shock protein 9/12 n=1 Tax=Pycnoporus cinnabarinus TaxID=5643 RepID=A0A060S4G8_PYCCI|nr:hypothetical protein BN946_scf185042.g132 [Trametes cinnabarina]